MTRVIRAYLLHACGIRCLTGQLLHMWIPTTYTWTHTYKHTHIHSTEPVFSLTTSHDLCTWKIVQNSNVHDLSCACPAAFWSLFTVQDIATCVVYYHLMLMCFFVTVCCGGVRWSSSRLREAQVRAPPGHGEQCHNCMRLPDFLLTMHTHDYIYHMIILSHDHVLSVHTTHDHIL